MTFGQELRTEGGGSGVNCLLRQRKVIRQGQIEQQGVQSLAAPLVFQCDVMSSKISSSL